MMITVAWSDADLPRLYHSSKPAMAKTFI